MEQLNGVVERVTYCNNENGFSVIKLKSKYFSDLVTLIGNLAAINIGSVITAWGEWKNNSKFGKQFIVIKYEESIPATIAGIEKYLGSGLIKGIRAANARKIVAYFKDDTIRIIEEEPHRLTEIDGIGQKKVETITKAWEQQKEIKNVMLFLQSHDISAAFAVKIYKNYGNNSVEIVKQNPYRLADDIWGIGFKTADKIAQSLGLKKDSYPRCKAGIIYCLNELSGDGHCFATTNQLLEITESLLELDKEIILNTINPMIQEKVIILDGKDAIYLPAFYHSEIGIANRIKEILSKSSIYSDIDMDGIISGIQRAANIEYDEIQIQAIKAAVRSKFMILTGGPGTGKTTITLAIIRIFEKLGANIFLAAPTGRAAKRMSEASGKSAKTIHRLLEYKPGMGYTKNSENQLDGDVLIIDEFSMVDTILMYNLLKAIPDKSIVVLIGDIDQLPSVGPGNILRDIIESEVVRVVKLNKIFRQSMNSMIITNAHRVNRGFFPSIESKKDSDFFFIEESEPQKAVELIKNLCTKRLPSYYKVDPVNNIQVLSPMVRGILGVSNINTLLQEALNSSTISIKYGGVYYKINDKVMQIKNNYDKGVFNGDIGKIAQVNTEDKYIIVNFDGNFVEYDLTEMDELTLAYAITIHKSQGSEYDIVVAPITTQHYVMLQRNLIYTCITRAKKIMVLVGSKKALAMSVKNSKSIERNTMLCERLLQLNRIEQW